MFTPFYRDVQLTDRIWWGKWKGKYVYEVIEGDRGWVYWAMESLNNFHLSPEAFEYLIEMEKPVMSQAQMDKFWDRYTKGEEGVLDKAREHFRMEGVEELINAYKQFEPLRK
jgi:hypothetical protein